MSSLIREPNTAYAEKVKVLLPSLNVSMCLQCTTAGTTSSGDLIVSKPSIGNTVTDGTVVWTIKEIGGVTTKDLESHNTAADAHADIRQAIEDIDVSQDIQKHNTDPDAHANMKAGVPVGTIIATGNINIPDGYLLCDGGVISRTTYSALFAAVKETYGAGDGSTTFALPNLIDRVVQGSATAGIYKEAGLPNITGQFGGWNSTVPTGAFEIVSASQNAQGTFSYGYNVINFNASR